MKDRLREQLLPVCRRQKLEQILSGSFEGICWGAGVAAAMALFAAESASLLWVWAGLAALLSIPLLVMGRLALRPVNVLNAARAVDDHFRLKDQTATAWQLARRDNPTAMDTLQMQGAVERLAGLPLNEAVTLSVAPRCFLRAMACLAVAGMMMLVGYSACLDTVSIDKNTKQEPPAGFGGGQPSAESLARGNRGWSKTSAPRRNWKSLHLKETIERYFNDR